MRATSRRPIAALLLALGVALSVSTARAQQQGQVSGVVVAKQTRDDSAALLVQAPDTLAGGAPVRRVRLTVDGLPPGRLDSQAPAYLSRGGPAVVASAG